MPEDNDNQQTIKAVVKSCLSRVDGCPDYSRSRIGEETTQKTAEMALNFFMGAMALADILGNKELSGGLSKIAFLVSIRGLEELERLEKKGTEDAARN